MKILPESQIENLPILEAVLEELRLNIIDHLQYLADAKYLYSLTSQEIKQKLGLLGLSSINIGRFISLNLESDEFEYISPEFYKMYRKLNQHRGNKMSMDYIFHSAGMMNTLVHSNDKYYNATNIFDSVGSFFDFNTYRDNQFPELEVGDGYIIVPYTSNKTQLLKQYLASNPIIFNFLPAGYTFIFFSEYRNSYNTGVLQYDNILNYLDDQDIQEYLKPLYWEPFDAYDVEEEILYPDSDTGVTFTRTLYYYDPVYFRDNGYPAFVKEHSRFADDSLYMLPYKDDTYTFRTLEEYLAYYTMLLTESVLTDYEAGLEEDLNNQLFYRDEWVGDYLLSYMMGENIESDLMDHVKGLQTIQSPSYSYASLYQRGQSIASQYLQREQGITSKTDTLIQENKPEIISDRRELDLIKLVFNDVYSLWMLLSNSVNEASELIQVILGYDQTLSDYLANNLPALLKDDLDYTTAEDLFNQFVNSLPYHGASMQFCVKDSVGNIVLINEINNIVYNTVANNYIAGRASVIYRNSMVENPPEPPEPQEDIEGYIVVDSNGTINHSIPFGDMYLHQIQHSVEMVNFYFTVNGSAETENTLLRSGIDAPLYNADGSIADDIQYDGAYASTYTQANGNMFESDGGDFVESQNGRLYLNPDGDRLALSIQIVENTPGPTPTALRAYFTVNGESQQIESEVGQNVGVMLYDKNGQTIPYDINKLYKILAVYNRNGDSLDWNQGDDIHWYFGELMWYAQANPVPYYALYLEYEEIEPDGVICNLSYTKDRTGRMVGYNDFEKLYDNIDTNYDLPRMAYDYSKTYSIEKVYDINYNEIEFDTNDFLYDNDGYMLWYSNVLPATGSPYWARCIIIKVEE